MDLKKRFIASSFFVLDLATLLALQFTSKLRSLTSAHNIITLFRCLILICNILIIKMSNFASETKNFIFTRVGDLWVLGKPEW